jgi:hypothetical protein
MNKTKQFLILLCIPLLLGGCGNATEDVTSTEPFNPIMALTTEPDEATPGYGPYRKSLQTAISYDGLTFVPTDEMISGQAHAPDAVIKDGDIYLYYSGWIVGNQINDIALALSEDNGQTWEHRNILIEELPELSDPTHPDILLLDDNTFRLYFSAHTWTQNGIFYADSTDGINFVYKGVVGVDEQTPLIDSTTHVIDNVWYQYAFGQTAEEIYVFDGDQNLLDFKAITSFPPNGEVHKPINGYWLNEKYHLLMIEEDAGVMRSMSTINGTDWYVDDGERMSALDDVNSITDATVVQLEDTYLMIYSLYQPE